MGFHLGAYFVQNSMASQLSRKETWGGVTAGAIVTAVSSRKSFWLVPASLLSGTPRAPALAKYMDWTEMLQMGWQVTSETLTSSMGMPSKRICMSSMESIETPPRPTSA
jgi:hypothetical protein